MEVKKTSLSRFFGVYALKLFMVPVVIVLVVLVAFSAAVNTGVLHLANYEETLIFEAARTIEQAEAVTPEMIPETVEYVLLNKAGTEIMDQGNMSKKHIAQMWEYVDSNVQPMGLDNPAFRIIESVHSVCVVRYSIIAKFSNPFLRTVFPNPELAMILLCTIIFIVSLLILNKHATGRMKNELQKLLKTTDKIAQQDLNFDSEENNFKELQTVTDSLGRMRDALKTSLDEQIKLEQVKSHQIGALAHDIKIPVTIIRGNTELLSLTELNGKQKEFADDIHSAALQIENYTRTLVEVSKLHSSATLNKAEVLISTILSELEREFRAYIKNRNMEFVLKNEVPPGTTIFADSGLIHRAVMNTLCNGAEHGNRVEKIIVTAMLNKNNELVLEVQDDGDGFSEEALKHGTELFYTQNEARNSDGHYGIGLSFANQAAKLHGGSFTIQNNDIGGQVRFVIPYDVKR